MLRLYALPARLVAIDVIVSFLVISTSLARPIRPETNDLTTQVQIVLLAMTMGSVVDKLCAT